MSRPSTFFGASKRTVTTTHKKKRMIRTTDDDDDAGAFLRRIARDVFSLSFCLSLSLSLSVFRIPNNTQRRERDDILERQNFRERRERRIELLGSPPFQNISPLFFVCTALYRVLHFCEKGKKKTARFLPPPQQKEKKRPDNHPLCVSNSLDTSLLSLSLSAFITPPLEEGQPKAFFGGGGRRRRRRRSSSSSSSSSFSIRREKKEERARENSFLCRACAGGFKFKLGNQNDIREFAFFVGDYIDRAIRTRGDTFCAPRDGCFFLCALKRARRRRDGCVGVWWRWSSSASRTTRGIDDDEKHQWRVFARFVDVRGARVTGMAGTTTTTNGREDGENEN